VLPLAALSAQEPQVVESIEWRSTVGAVSFPHRLHVEDLEIECADCHHETNAARLDMPHPEYLEDFWIDCESCHQASAVPAAPQACSSCHHDSPVHVADETLSSKVVIHRSCWNCHDVTTGADASRSCADCHRRPSAQPVEGSDT
jgi:hypothetical protein